MPCARRVEHECSESREDITLRVVIGSFENIDFFTKLRCFADDFPCLTRWSLVAGNHR